MRQRAARRPAAPVGRRIRGQEPPLRTVLHNGCRPRLQPLAQRQAAL